MFSFSCVSEMIKFLSLSVCSLSRSKFAFVIKCGWELDIFRVSMLFCIGVQKMLFIDGKRSSISEV